MLTVLLVVGMEVVNDLAHSVEGEILRIEGEHSSLIHVVWVEVSSETRRHKQQRVPMSVHIVSRGIPASAYFEITVATST